MTVITVHSYKGGTGKTSLCLNLSAMAAKRGRDVVLLEFDLDGPNLHTMFKTAGFVNDYIEGKKDIEKIVVDAGRPLNLPGKFRVAVANPRMEAIRKAISMDRAEQLDSLKRLMAVKKTFANDLVFIDTSPGVTYSSINAVLSSDKALVVARPDVFDMDGTARIVNEFYGGLEKRTGLVVNDSLEPEDAAEVQKAVGIPILERIPWYREVKKLGGREIFSLRNPNHEFTRIIEGLVNKVERL